MKEIDSNPLKKLLYALLKMSKADLAGRFAKAKISITPLQYGVLAVIKSEPITINDLAKKFDFKPPSLVPVANALEKAGLLKREPNRRDRRKIQLIITKKGLNLFKKFPFDDKNDALNTAFMKLKLAKQKQLLDLLQELTDNFPK